MSEDKPVVTRPFEDILGILSVVEADALRTAVQHLDTNTLTYEQVIHIVRHERAHREEMWNRAVNQLLGNHPARLDILDTLDGTL